MLCISAATITSVIAPPNIKTVAHANVTHGPHVFVGDDQYTMSSRNQMCERGGGSPATACPPKCEIPAAQQGRVRRAVHTLSTAEWRKVVDAIWVLTAVHTKEGKQRYGDSYFDYTFHQFFHAVNAYANNLTKTESEDTDITGGGPQQPAWHAYETLMLENSLLAVDPSIGGMPYIDWTQMTGAVWDTYFGTMNGTRINGTSGRDLYIIDSGPFAHFPVPQFNFTTWFHEQSDELQAFFSEVERFWDNSTAWEEAGLYEAFASGTTLETQLAFKGGQIRSGSAPTGTPYVTRGNVGATFMEVMNGLEWDTLVNYCTSNRLGWHNEFVACIEGRLVTQANMTYPASMAAVEHVPDMHLTVHFAAGGTPPFGGDFTDPRAAGYDPIFWFHHSGIDWLRRTWQHNNEALRPWAYGYPVVGGYKYAKVGLYDCLGCQAYDLGFDDYNLKELGRRRGKGTPADIMCGSLDTLYTYDTLLSSDTAEAAAVATATADTAEAAVVATTTADTAEAAVVATTTAVTGSITTGLLFLLTGIVLGFLVYGISRHVASRFRAHRPTPELVNEYDFSHNEAHLKATAYE